MFECPFCGPIDDDLDECPACGGPRCRITLTAFGAASRGGFDTRSAAVPPFPMEVTP